MSARYIPLLGRAIMFTFNPAEKYKLVQFSIAETLRSASILLSLLDPYVLILKWYLHIKCKKTTTVHPCHPGNNQLIPRYTKLPNPTYLNYSTLDT